MVKRYTTGADGDEYEDADGYYVRASDYDALAVESEARHQSCLVLMKSVTQHRARIAALEAALRQYGDHLVECKWLAGDCTCGFAALAPESPKGG